MSKKVIFTRDCTSRVAAEIPKDTVVVREDAVLCMTSSAIRFINGYEVSLNDDPKKPAKLPLKKKVR